MYVSVNGEKRIVKCELYKHLLILELPCTKLLLNDGVNFFCYVLSLKVNFVVSSCFHVYRSVHAYRLFI